MKIKKINESAEGKPDWSPNKWAINATVLIIALPVAYKIATTPFSLQIDLNALLSLLLALFSVGLSALFYFKANETSNNFYDNTYKFTKDIAELLVRIESGFGERLKHLDEGYSSMRDYIQTSTNKQNGDVEKTKQKIESEEQEVEKVVEERNRIIQQLVERSQLQEEEKAQFTTQLKAKEEELTNVQHELTKLNRRLAFERIAKRRLREDFSDIAAGMSDFTYSNVIRKIGIEKILMMPSLGIRKNFEKIQKELPRGYIDDLELNGLYDGELTIKGVNYLKEIANKFRDK